MAIIIIILAAAFGQKHRTRAMTAAVLQELLSEQAKKERAKKGGHAKHGTTPPDSCLEHTSCAKQKEKSVTTAAKAGGVSRRKVEMASIVRKQSPELAAQVVAGAMPDGVIRFFLTIIPISRAREASFIIVRNEQSARFFLPNVSISHGDQFWCITDFIYGYIAHVIECQKARKGEL